ncbi:uncharacterized protein BCR38DRAFT_346269 [Pseudomassariella vexata]|uniref:Copper-fist domain-containing protein n=1 Tax=Pseudomassariella vexata TaxID=1141098 RepID=A0A1Y2DTQ3_9PEZI|nr:uncharacterized protein BCR38DRAFT_346269 [Pseudomassariella vexata]ORY62672.1 hypothetical protein BCR38DRAFT_346269 [Pseudomassariella vexata]
MPVIHGQKMACEPCIRGHRSTKCNHGGERLLVPVRKPGRPLSTCPHPPGNACACGGVTAAIPRRGKCACPSSGPGSAQNPVKVEPPASDGTPLSPAKSSFRVSKAVPKATRKQSYDPSNLGRMDASNFNVMGSYGPMPGQPRPGVATIDAVTSTYAPQFTNGYEHAPEPVFHNPGPFQMSAPVANGSDRPRPTINTELPLRLEGPTDRSPTTSTNGTRTSSCCSGISAASGASSVARHTPTSSSGSISHELAPTKPAGGCCAPKVDSEESSPFNSFGAPVQPGNGTSMMEQYPMSMNGQIYAANYQQATIFSYPASYGTYLHPLQASQWQAMAAALDYPSPSSSSIAYPVSQPIAMDHTGFDTPGTIHECGCGPNCSCIGCAAHPYNAATREYVSSALKYQNMDGTATFDPIISGQEVHSQSPVDESSPGHSDTTSAVSGEDQTYSEEDYFFVKYSTEEDCQGQEASCPCGDECACTGCLTHGNNNLPA